MDGWCYVPTWQGHQDGCGPHVELWVPMFAWEVAIFAQVQQHNGNIISSSVTALRLYMHVLCGADITAWQSLLCPRVLPHRGAVNRSSSQQGNHFCSADPGFPFLTRITGMQSPDSRLLSSTRQWEPTMAIHIQCYTPTGDASIPVGWDVLPIKGKGDQWTMGLQELPALLWVALTANRQLSASSTCHARA